MPLHLLGKKSWNVYNPENVARVRRDEAHAKALEEEEERQMQKVDAERRIQLLRGERPRSLSPPLQLDKERNEANKYIDKDSDNKNRHKKRRRLAGEDDTDRDIRFAREDAVSNGMKRDELLRAAYQKHASHRAEHISITDSAGHINLFTEEMTRNTRADKNPEAEAEKSRKKRALEDQYTMRFSNAAGHNESAGQTPWYSSINTSKDMRESTDQFSNTNVWGNEDPMRKEREKARMDSNDPLAAMKAGVRGLKNAQRERKEWQQQRLRELDDFQNTQKSQQKRSRRRRSRSQDSAASLEGFSLDSSNRKHGKESRHRRRHRHRH